MKTIKKNNFCLINNNENSFKIFSVIKKKIPASVFCVLEFDFFKDMINEKFINIFYLTKKNKIAAIITVIKYKDFINLKKKIIFYLLKNPHKLFFHFKILLNTLNRNKAKNDFIISNDYLHLLHLVIKKEMFYKNSLKEKDDLFNFFFKKIVKNFNAKYFYLCYEKNNIKAHKFYKRNKFEIYETTNSAIFVKKKFV